MSKKFPYGDQFSAGSHVENLSEMLNLIFQVTEAAQEALFDDEGERPVGNREALKVEIADTFLSDRNNPVHQAGNTMKTLDHYGLIDREGESYAPTELSRDLYNLDNDEAENRFARHLLVNKYGLLTLKVIEDIKSRGEKPGKVSVNRELYKLGFENTESGTVTYFSTMKSWLQKVGIFESIRYDSINWARVREVTGMGKEVIDDVYNLSRVHKYFLQSMIQLGVLEYKPSSDIADYVRSVFKVEVTRDSIVEKVLKPLEDKGLIETQKATEGRGAKSHLVRLTDETKNNVLVPYIDQIQSVTDLPFPTLNKSFSDVVDGLDSEETHEKGEALELFAVWMVRLLGLRFTEWRVRSAETGHGEVDVMAASDRYVYNRWQIQCKNTQGKVDLNVIAKEYGLSIMTKADVIMIVTTSEFTPDARDYADELMRQSRFYVVMINGDDVDRIREDKTAVVDVMNEKAERVFYRKEVLSRQLDEEF